MKPAILVGYFVKRHEALDALKALRKKGFRRVAWVSKGVDGEIRSGDPFIRLQISGAILAFILVGLVAALSISSLQRPERLFELMPFVFGSALVAGVIGALLSFVLIRRSIFGIERKLISNHSRWLVNGETVLLLQAPIEQLRIPMTIMLETGEIPPAVFVLHPKRKSRSQELNNVPNHKTPLSLTQLCERARRLANEHQIDARPIRNTALLKRLELSRRWVQRICLDLTEASHLQLSVPPTAEWLLDNEYIFESNARDVRLNLPRQFYRQLPTLQNEFNHGFPRVYSLARDLAEHTDLRIDEESALAFIIAYQTAVPLSIGELWSFPQMVRIALVEGIERLASRAFSELREQEIADFWANRLITSNRRNPDQLFAIMVELTTNHPNPSPFFASQLIDYLYDEQAALAPVLNWLEHIFHKPPTDLAAKAKTRQAKDLISIGNAFTSLRQLSLLDWKECFEKLSWVEKKLREDPAGIYPHMDFGTRDRYRRAIEDLQRGSGVEELQIAKKAIDLAISGRLDSGLDARESHVGTYLIGDKRGELARLIACHEKLRFRSLRWAHCNHSSLFFISMGAFTAALIGLALFFGLRAESWLLQALFTILLLFPASQLSLDLLNTIIIRLFPSNSLPKMDFSATGIPDEYRTLVVVPMMLIDEDKIKFEAEKLEIRFLGNKEANLIYGLYSDYKDADQPRCDSDERLFRTAIQCIETLNERYGEPRFFLFHRERKWSDSEQKYIGWERKRGKIEELNNLIVGARKVQLENLVKVGDSAKLTSIKYVITLDSDTQLPLGAARRLIETLAHPLNHVRFDENGHVLSGYTIIQPRVSASLPSSSGSPFSRLFSDPVGIDPYTSTVSDAYQDLTGEGSYHGKGIYDVRAFNQALSDRFPPAWLLSHDLIEGAHVRVGLASDIELYDEFPQDYLSYVKRQHRWIRGDWQILDWILPYVPLANKDRAANPLAWFDRWKILDNLRRSLLSIASVALLITAWLVSSKAGYLASIVVATQMLFHTLLQPFAWVTTRNGLKSVSADKVMHDLLRVVAEATLLPFQAWLALDAIIRVWYRRHISHRYLLEWASAQAVQKRTQTFFPMFMLWIGMGSLFSLLIAGIVAIGRPVNLQTASPWLVLWCSSPLIGWMLCRRPLIKRSQAILPEEDVQFLRSIARRTWRYFTDFVTEETSWLPPDNYQVSYQIELAMRTSPTNIGLYLTSVLSAHDFGYLSVDDVEQKLSQTMKAILKLERHEGHLLNWYDVQSLAPLQPRYVSMVDSGNLLGSLWALRQGLESLMQRPLLDRQAFAGLYDTGSILRSVAQEEKFLGLDLHAFDELMNTWGSPSDSITDKLALLRQTERNLSLISEPEFASLVEHANVTYWAGQIRAQTSSWLNVADRYLKWIELLSEKSEQEIAALDPEALEPFRECMRSAPSLLDLATGNIPFIGCLERIKKNMSVNKHGNLDWIHDILAAYGKAKWLAGEMLALIEQLARESDELSASLNMRFLYNAERRLFSVGYNVSEGRLDRAFYDLLASEARLGSFIAIARGDIPAEHWFAMSRPYGAVGQRKALLSWTGTMFEYMMPLLFMRSSENALLDKSARDAVAIQINYGRKHLTPWGISECAFGEIDSHKIYQYQAFGVPELGLKRELANKIVVAPYATFLAMSFEPRGAVQNLKRLADLGLSGEYGYYESLDYSRQPSREITAGVIVRTYMAHHQGMSMLALSNFLRDDYLKQQFHNDIRVQTVEPLLYERIPQSPPMHHIATRERVASVAKVGELIPSVSQFETPHTSTPKTQLLSNGRFHLMLTASGGGYSRWGDFDVTRWRSDQTQDLWGSFCYIRDLDMGRLWCNTYQPTCGNVDQYCANFTLDRAVFRRVDNDIESETEVIVAPDDDVEIRRLTFINRSTHTRRIELTTYTELALAPHNTDRQHPVFNKLFIQTEALTERRTLLAYRRLRSSSEQPIFVAHCFTHEQTAGRSAEETLRFETDRRLFIGRGRTLTAPMGATQEPGGSQGFVLDPIFSMRQGLTLPPGRRIQISLILAAASTRDEVLRLSTKYSDPHSIDRAMDLAWAAGQLELRLLRIQPDEARRFQHLASYLLYPNVHLRFMAHHGVESLKGQAGLWTYGISGDLPITLVAISEQHDLGLVRQMLQAHSYWRMHGLKTDLVILNEESGGYSQPLRDELEHLIMVHGSGAGLDQPGGVFLRNSNLIPIEDIALLRAASSIILVAARGALHQQLAGPGLEEPPLPKIFVKKRDIHETTAELPFMELPFFNSLGGFTSDGREYVVYLGPGMNTPAPWVNVIASPTFGILISETGAGFTWQGNSQRNRLMAWSNDPVIDPPSEAIYIRDEETGSYWTPTASPIREESAYRSRHGAGYSVFEHNSHGIEQELTVFIPLNDKGGDPIKLQRLVLFNNSGRQRKLSLTYYVEWTLGESRETTQMHIATSWEEDAQVMLARNRYHPDYPEKIAFAGVSAPISSYSGDRTVFIGRNRSLVNPAAMDRVGLASRTGPGLDPCATVQTNLKLTAGERVEITFMLGQADSLEQISSLTTLYRNDHDVETALQQTKEWWNNQLGVIQVETPEPATDLMLNRWLIYQNLSCRFWGRSAFYQSGGAFGFRDQLQDVMALLYANPLLARAHILLAASRQFKEGDVQHWWHPPRGEGIRSRISDDLLWLPFVVAQYVRITADVSILSELVPFLDAPVLESNQMESFQLPGVSTELATLYEHCERAVMQGSRFGAHGLPLIGAGDWNDGLNLVGAGGKGESVWLAWFLVDVLRGMAELAYVLGKSEISHSFIKNRDELSKNIEQHGWDGEWYLRGTYDDGALLGSSSSIEAQIDSLPQSWAWLSGVAEKTRAEKAIESAWNHLVKVDEGVALLFEPPFDKSIPSPGYIQGYPPGVRENGGQYTHAAIWLAMAMARSGDSARATQILRMLNPIEHSREPEAVWRYGIEPYVIAADIYRLPGRSGQGGWSWYTGSAAWMYRAWVEEILGFKLRGDILQIAPIIPSWWDGFKISYKHGAALYKIEIENPEHREKGVAWMELDGQRLKDNLIPLVRESSEHLIVVRIGSQTEKL